MTDRQEFTLGVLTISDAGAKGERDDTSGDIISDKMARRGFRQVHRTIVPDEREMITATLCDWCDSGEVDIILTTGGTGLGPRDVTPEATRASIQFEVPGIGEAMRTLTHSITPMSMLSRALAGVRSGCLIVNLPGSPKAVEETLEAALPALPHALEMIKGWRGHPQH